MRLIDADELIPLIKMGEMNTYCELGEGRNGGIAFAIERINQMPTIEERKKGKWEEINVNKDMTHNIRCNQCQSAYKSRGHANSFYTKQKFKYCPCCGADMRGEE